MANVIGEFVAKIGADTKKFNTSVDKSQTRMGKFADGVKKHGKTIALAFIAIGTAASAAAFKIVKDFAAAGDEVQKMALRTGFTTEALSELRLAAELSGTSIQGLEKGVKRMATTLLDAEQGLSTAVDAMNELNLTIGDFEGLSPEAAFEKFLIAIANLEDPLKRAAVAQDIFGRAGTAMLPMLADGAEGLAAMRQEAHDLGIVFDQEAANAAARFNDDMTRLGGTIDGLKFKIAEELIPTLNALAVAFTQLLKGEGVFTAQGQAVNELIEARTNFLIEQEKAQRGVDNEMKKAAETLIETAHAWRIATDGGIANLALLGEIVGPLERWLATEEERLDALALEEVRLINQALAEIKYRDALDFTIQGLMEAAQAEKDLAAAVVQAEADKAAAREAQRAQSMETTFGQIVALGGAPSAESLRQFELLTQRQPGDVILDGEKVGQFGMDFAGEGFLGESHMSGGNP